MSDTPAKPAKPKAAPKKKRKVRKYSPEFKARVVSEVASGRLQSEVAAAHGLSHGQVSTWVSSARAGALTPPVRLATGAPTPLLPPRDSDELRSLREEVATLRAERTRLRKVLAVLLE